VPLYTWISTYTSREITSPSPNSKRKEEKSANKNSYDRKKNFFFNVDLSEQVFQLILFFWNFFFSQVHLTCQEREEKRHWRTPLSLSHWSE
jgi:hypothetical protein